MLPLRFGKGGGGRGGGVKEGRDYLKRRGGDKYPLRTMIINEKTSLLFCKVYPMQYYFNIDERFSLSKSLALSL